MSRKVQVDQRKVGDLNLRLSTYLLTNALVSGCILVWAHLILDGGSSGTSFIIVVLFPCKMLVESRKSRSHVLFQLYL